MKSYKIVFKKKEKEGLLKIVGVKYPHRIIVPPNHSKLRSDWSKGSGTRTNRIRDNLKQNSNEKKKSFQSLESTDENEVKPEFHRS